MWCRWCALLLTLHLPCSLMISSSPSRCLATRAVYCCVARRRALKRGCPVGRWSRSSPRRAGQVVVIGPAVVDALCVAGGLGLMALVIAEGLVGVYWNQGPEQAESVVPESSIQRDRDDKWSGVTVWELRFREQADALPHFPVLLGRLPGLMTTAPKIPLPGQGSATTTAGRRVVLPLIGDPIALSELAVIVLTAAFNVWWFSRRQRYRRLRQRAQARFMLRRALAGVTEKPAPRNADPNRERTYESSRGGPVRVFGPTGKVAVDRNTAEGCLSSPREGDPETIYWADVVGQDRDEDIASVANSAEDRFFGDLGQPVDHGYTGHRQIFRDRSGAPILARELGRRLRRAQDASGLSGITLARKLGVSTSTLSRMMTGVLVPTVAEAAAVLALCGVSGDTRDRVLDLCHPRHDDGILRLTDGAQWDAFLFHSARAIRLIDYQPMMIPWVAQTYDYAAAWLSRPLGKPEYVLTTSMDKPTAEARSAIPTLRPGTSRVELIVHEWALRTPVGDRSMSWRSCASCCGYRVGERRRCGSFLLSMNFR